MRHSHHAFRSHFECTRHTLKSVTVTLLVVLAAALASAQDIPIGVTYVCNGEHIYIEGCNVRDTSDTSTCMVAHPDHLTPTGLNTYTSMTRGALKKLLPTCVQPSAKQLAAAQAFQKRQQDLYNANVQKAEQQLKAATTQPAGFGQPAAKPKSPEERRMNRCITSGRLPASCTGNALLGGFTQMISSMLPSAAKEAAPGANMAGVFQGAGNWRLDFITDGVLVNCSFLSPDQHNYKIEFKSGGPTIVIDTTPKPLVLTYRADGTIVGPGPVTIDGVVAAGYTPGSGNTYSGGYHDQNGMAITDSQAASSAFPVYDGAGNRVYGAVNANSGGHTNFAPKRTTCPALNLSSKGAGVGIETMQTDLLKTMFGGDKGPPTPPGIRMHGIFAASTGFSVQFFPESVILGCGPDAARAYPYTVTAEGNKAVIKINAPDRPLTLAFRPDGSLDPGGTGPYQVHGRVVTGQDNNDDFTFAPYEQTCNLAVLTPSKEVPSGGGTAAMMTASAGAPGAGPAGGNVVTPPAGPANATLSVVSGLPGAPNPLAGHTFVLLRQSYEAALSGAGLQAPAGTSLLKGYLAACMQRQPACQVGMAAANASTVAGARADASGKAQLPAVAAGTYYFFCLGGINKQLFKWDFPVNLKPGANTVTLDQRNAVPVN